MDGMSFLIQINSDTPGLSDLLGGLDKASVSVAKVSTGLKGLDEGTRRGAAGAKEIEGAFDKATKNALAPFLQHAERIAEFEFVREGVEKLLELPGEIAEKIFDLGEEALMTAAKTERMGRAFENALGPDVGREAFKYFDAIADSTEYSHEQIRGMGLELSKSGFKGEGLKNAIAAVADLGSMTENPVEGGAAATAALQRIITTGRIEGRALVPFGIQKGDFEKELSSETGLGIKAMRKEMEAGKIPIETTLNSLYKTITNKTGQDLGGVGTGMTDTMTSRLTHLKEKPDLMFEGLADSEGFKQISDFVGRLGDALDPNSAIGKILTGSLESAFNELGTTLEGIDLEAVFTEVGGVIKGLPDDLHMAGVFVRDELVPAVQTLWDIFKGILDTINLTAKGLGIAKDAVHDYTPIGAATDALHSSQGRSEKAVDIMQGEGSLPSQGNGLGGFLGKNVPGYSFLEDRVFNPHFWALRFGKATAAGENDVKGYSGGIQATTPEAVGAMSTLADATTDALKDAHQQHSPSALFRDIAANDVAGYIEGLGAHADDVEDAVTDTYGAPEATAGGGGGGGSFSVTVEGINITIEGGSGNPYESGRLAARGAEDEIELVFMRILEKMARKMGAG